MALPVLENIKKEVTCPICLELMTEPVSVDCGHFFCKICITLSYQYEKGEEGVGHCPVCRVTYRFENLRPGEHVENIAGRLKELALTPKAVLCGLHGYERLLFCKEDGTVICWLCEHSQKHQGHHTVLMEEAAQEYEEMLDQVLEKLKKDEKQIVKWEAYLKGERTSWKEKIQREIKSVQAEFKKMRNVLDSEERELLQKLKQEEEEALKVLAESEKQLAQEAQSVRELIADVHCRLQGSARAMLQDVKDTIERSRLLTVTGPRTCPKRQKMAFQAPDLKGIIHSHQAPMIPTSSNSLDFTVRTNSDSGYPL